MSAREPWAAELDEYQVRTASPSDRAAVAAFLAAMDRSGLYQRHFAHGEAPNLALLDRIEAIDQRDRVAVLAIGADGRVLGHGEYVAAQARGEFAFMVLPEFRAKGIGSRLLEVLLGIAAAAGQQEMHGIIQANNRAALKLTLNHGFKLVPGDEAATVIVSRQLAPRRAAEVSGRDAGAARHPNPDSSHDPDRTPLYRRPGPGTPFRARGGQMQRIAADAVGGGQEA